MERQLNRSQTIKQIEPSTSHSFKDLRFSNEWQGFLGSFFESGLRAAPLMRVRVKFTVKFAACQESSTTAYGVFEGEFGIGSHEWSCPNGENKSIVRLLALSYSSRQQVFTKRRNGFSPTCVSNPRPPESIKSKEFRRELQCKQGYNARGLFKNAFYRSNSTTSLLQSDFVDSGVTDLELGRLLAEFECGSKQADDVLAHSPQGREPQCQVENEASKEEASGHTPAHSGNVVRRVSCTR